MTALNDICTTPTAYDARAYHPLTFVNATPVLSVEEQQRDLLANFEIAR
jgi:hypothetical protein